MSSIIYDYASCLIFKSYISFFYFHKRNCQESRNSKYLLLKNICEHKTHALYTTSTLRVPTVYTVSLNIQI